MMKCCTNTLSNCNSLSCSTSCHSAEDVKAPCGLLGAGIAANDAMPVSCAAENQPVTLIAEAEVPDGHCGVKKIERRLTLDRRMSITNALMAFKQQMPELQGSTFINPTCSSIRRTHWNDSRLEDMAQDDNTLRVDLCK